MIVALIDDHVGTGRHMTGRAGEGRIHRVVSMVADFCVLRRGVTLQTGVVTRKPQLGAVGIVAIAACDTGRKHLALLERAIIVYFLAIHHLSVRMIEAARDRRNHVGVG